jgi:hypothetical protein
MRNSLYILRLPSTSLLNIVLYYYYPSSRLTNLTILFNITILTLIIFPYILAYYL